VPRIDKADAAISFPRHLLYLYAALAGAKVFPKEANFNLISAGEDDVVTRHHLDTELQKHQENL
jgi:hypothetical protein